MAPRRVLVGEPFLPVASRPRAFVYFRLLYLFTCEFCISFILVKRHSPSSFVSLRYIYKFTCDSIKVFFEIRT